MPHMAAYLASQRPHQHDWQPLEPRAGDDGQYQWCPLCGAVRHTSPAETDD